MARMIVRSSTVLARAAATAEAATTTSAISAGPLRLSLWAFAGVALATYVFEYAVIPLQDQATRDVLSPQPAQTLFRLPLFFAYLAVLITGVATLTRKSERAGLDENRNRLTARQT